MYDDNPVVSYWHSYIEKIILTNEKITDFSVEPESIITGDSGQAFYEASDPNFEEYDGPTINMFLIDSYPPSYEYYKEYEEGDEEIDHNITYIFKFNTPTTFNYIYLFFREYFPVLNNNAMGDVYVSNNSTNGVDGDWTLIKENVIEDNKTILHINSSLLDAIEIPMNTNEDVQIITQPFSDLMIEAYLEIETEQTEIEGVVQRLNFIHKVIVTNEKITPESSWETIKSMNVASFPEDIVYDWSSEEELSDFPNIFDTDIETSAYGYYTPSDSSSLSSVCLQLNFGVEKVVKYMYILATVPENYDGYNVVVFANIDEMYKDFENILNVYAGSNVFLEIPVTTLEPIVSLPIMEDYPLS